ncbi:MAG TPA: nucleotide disphospho-sugar-binding domain-containing protein [Solirubrobacteraceae bacterium]|nr:nucleotide disphospho-sugar-binding domain-containing protein [Solirubrobacteraceae bacterium]
MTPDPQTIVFFPEGAFGPTNNCVGIGDVLRRRGHRVVFIVEESFAGTLEAKGFEERLMRLGPPPAVPEAPGQFWKDFVRDTAPVFRASTVEQLEGFILPTWQALVDGARYVDERLVEIIGELEPDVVVEDNVCAFPALLSSGRPWARIMSCNPLELRDPALPPVFSGLPSEDRSQWEAFEAEYARVVGPLQREFSAWCVERGAPPLPGIDMIHESPWLNLALYPDELDYDRSRPPAPTWHRLQTCVRATDEPWTGWAGSDSDGRALVYLSLGSLGSADLELMERLVALLADTPHRYVVSAGPRHDEYALADNMTGAEFLPQTSVLPHVEAVITHGGNNTVTECMWFGLPMIVLPIFWDQHDNAQRVHERGYGLRLPTYSLAAEALVGALAHVLGDAALRARAAAAGERLRKHPGTVRAAELIERVAATGEPVTR